MNEDSKMCGFETMITISKDYCQAHLSVETVNEGVVVSADQILEALYKKNIYYGIDYQAIEEIRLNPLANRNRLIASGTPCVNGTDGEVIFHVNKDKGIKPGLLPGGRVNFKEIDFLRNVTAGDILAERTMPTLGHNGMSVTGREILSRPGKEAPFKYGKNVYVSEDGLRLVAEKSGTVEFADEKIFVMEVLEIRHDIGPKTGNIQFSGKVVIHGNVLSGYEVVSDSDIVINGTVERALIRSSKDLTINGGVQGNGVAELDVKGNLKANFLNNVIARVEGDLYCDALLHCNINCAGSVRTEGKKGIIVGGNIVAGKAIHAKTVGSEMGTVTDIRLGTDSQIIEEYKMVFDEKVRAEEKALLLSNTKNRIQHQLEANPSEFMAEKLKAAVALANEYDAVKTEIEEQYRALTEKIEALKGAYLECLEIHAGVRIRICESLFMVRDSIFGVRFKQEGAVVEMIPL